MKYSLALILAFFTKTSFSQPKIGNPAPSVTITNWVQNKPGDISLKNKFIVIDFWATWCAPCLGSMPHLNKLVEQNKNNKNIVFLAMTDELPAKVNPILSRIPFKSAVVTDTTEKTQETFNVQNLPFCVVIDDNGIIQWTGMPSDLSNEMIQKIVNRKPLPVFSINQKSTSGNTKSYYDSLSAKYKRIFMDNSLKEYIEAGSFLKEGRGSNLSQNSSNIIKQKVLGCKTEDIFSELLAVSPVQISLPIELKDSYISYCYKSEINTSNKDIFNAILTSKKLTSIKVDSMQDVIVMEVYDTIRFKAANKYTSPGGNRHVSVSDDKLIIAIGNSRLADVLSSFMERFQCPIELTNTPVLKNLIDMVIDVKDFISFEKSMMLYGINVKKEKKFIPFYMIKYRENSN